MSSLEELRKNIDKIDNKLLDLLNERAKLSVQVKKTGEGDTSIRPERESAVVRRLSEKNHGPMPTIAVRQIFTQIISSFRDNMQLDRPISVSYLGPAGTYSEQAAIRIFGDSVELSAEESITDVVRAVESGSTDLAVVPIENSTEGALRETHKLLMETTSIITAEITIPIVHNLLSKEKKLEDIKQVYAHPQSLGQSVNWLKKHLPNAKLSPVFSNAEAAKLTSNSEYSAAVASSKAGEVYKLNTLKAGINDQPGNETRFIALSRLKAKKSKQDKTSLIVVLRDKPGALHEILGHFADVKISMTRLESQPYKPGEYAFYIDFIGHQDTQVVAKTLKLIEQNTKIFKNLGSYPIEIQND